MSLWVWNLLGTSTKARPVSKLEGYLTPFGPAGFDSLFLDLGLIVIVTLSQTSPIIILVSFLWLKITHFCFIVKRQMRGTWTLKITNKLKWGQYFRLQMFEIIVWRVKLLCFTHYSLSPSTFRQLLTSFFSYVVFVFLNLILVFQSILCYIRQSNKEKGKEE